MLPATAEDGGGINRNDNIITFINSLTKRAQWVAAQEANLTVKRFAEIFMDRHFGLHSLPATIVLDRHPRFTSDFYQDFTTIRHTRPKMSTALHTQTDGLAAMAN
jgi:hypothetical protein